MIDYDLLGSVLERFAGNAQLVEENYARSGYNVIRLGNRFFAIHQSEGNFELERFDSNEYEKPVFESETLGEMRNILMGKPSSQALRADHLQTRVRLLESMVKEFCRFVPPGHYYSPINSDDDVRYHAHFDRSAVKTMPGVPFDSDRHTKHLLTMIKEYCSLSQFVKSKTASVRYFYDNDEQSYFDAVAIRHFIQNYRPKRVIEIGGGYSTAAMMDAVDGCGIRTHFTLIEPDPTRLFALLNDADLASNKLVKDKVQNVPLELFDQLEAGDILFIDSSHVSKFRSDVNFYIFEILPRIKSGVVIHIHDVGYPFEYSPRFLEEGRSWNEVYILRAFLMYNASFRIEFWSAYASSFQGTLIAEKMPLCYQRPGGAFWMSRL